MEATGTDKGARTGAWRLEGSSSIYLREAAEQRIEWFPWGPEAFKEAKRSHRLILLDIGAAWCHWCHVMDQGTYSDAEVIRMVNELFVAVKVDRDQNPEVDRRYQRDINILTGGGGWPLTAFLNPDGETLLGGTYFPPRDQGRHPGMVRVLREVSRMWREEPASLKDNVGILREAAKRIEAHSLKEGELELTGSAEAIALSLGQAFDSANGGFGNSPKFPHPVALLLLLAYAREKQELSFAAPAELTLRKMAEGGMYDQLGGGFHRYSVDAGWHVPHFEKMTLDNAHLLRAYAEGAEFFPNSEFARVVEGILSYCQGVLQIPGTVGFAASVDADNSPGDDGSYYTWTREQLHRVLTPDEFKVVQWRFGIGADGAMPMEPDHNVLYQLLPVPEIATTLKKEEKETAALLQSATSKLLDAREARPKPLVDPAIYSSLNGALIGAFAVAARLTGSQEALDQSRRVADAIVKLGYVKEKGVAHRIAPGGVSGWGLLEDQAAFAWGLLDLAEATGEGRYLEIAREILDLIFREFLVPESGLLQDLAPKLYDGTTVGPVGAAPSYPLEDNPHLSPNATVALALIRLGDLHEDPVALQRAERLLHAMMRRVHGAGLFAAGAALAGLTLATPPIRVVVEGEGKAAEALYHAAIATYHPRKVVFLGSPKPPFAMPETMTSPSNPGKTARAILCEGSVCRLPIEDPTELAQVISSLPSKA